MLVANLRNATEHNYLSERFKKAYEFLAREDLATLETGRYSIDGTNVFANIMEYNTAPAAEKNMEAHKNYYDVQFVASGEEVLQYAPLESVEEAAPFDAEADFGMYGTPQNLSTIYLSAGDMVVVAPEDAHKPGCTAEAQSHVRKVVVKVHV